MSVTEQARLEETARDIGIIDMATLNALPPSSNIPEWRVIKFKRENPHLFAHPAPATPDVRAMTPAEADAWFRDHNRRTRQQEGDRRQAALITEMKRIMEKEKRLA